MPAVAQVHTIVLVPRTDLQDQMGEFLIDREARGLSERTLIWYRQQLDCVTPYVGQAAARSAQSGTTWKTRAGDV
jgi:hypothetical protein